MALLSLFKAATEVMDTGSLVEVDGFVIFTNSQGTQFFTAGTDDELTACEQDDVPASVLSRIKGRDFTDMTTSGCMFTYSPNLVDVVAVSAPKKPVVKFKKKRIQTPKPVEKVAPVAKEPAEMEPNNKLSVAELLQQCSDTIEELSGALHEAQVKTRSLTEIYGSQYRAMKARNKLDELGFIEKVGKGWNLTPQALQAKVAVQTRTEGSQFQLLRFTDKVLEYVPLDVATTPNKVALPVAVVAPDGQPHQIENVIQFAAKHDLRTSKVYLLLNGSLKTHKGWRLG